ncbi:MULTISPECIES: bifunctional 4-hydroxy-2-oxoglutarate aldolase/2-dehydro-3-deoxy-phosphogluconate aldolase [unclassified Paraflavitalea]|uniref:bifunctional 4-hydroxy-2-oxoglutarate aldolase/2-dehydro-3-deoxy-phosphogluconate aldolase n=1 Tax=unclassified Paraflavitalea TaxID=2798305 RepID=UPI003D3472F5
MENRLIIQKVKEQGIIPLFFHSDLQVSINVIDALYKAGIRIVEYTNRGEAALVNFTALVKEKKTRWPELLLAIGTIKTSKEADSFISAGADFIIAPVVTPEVAYTVHEAGKLWIPGCMTPTEIATAHGLGARFVKLFPGNILGPGFVSAIKELFPDMLFMPTGGVELTEKNLTEWFSTGVIAVGLGSKLITKEVLESQQYDQLTALTQKGLELVRSIKR